jgi:hypothetical protein
MGRLAAVLHPGMPCPTLWDPFFKVEALASIRAMSTAGRPVSKRHNSALPSHAATTGSSRIGCAFMSGDG